MNRIVALLTLAMLPSIGEPAWFEDLQSNTLEIER